MNLETPDISEKELIERCIAEERKFQEILYRKHADKMYGIALTYSNDQDDACDILQDSFIRVFRNLDKFKFEGPLEAWIRKIVVNTSLQLYKKQKREKEVYEDFGHTVQKSVVDGILEKINAADMMKMVNKLPEKAALVLKLFSIEGYGHQEIAELMGISVGTSKSQLNRARFLLKESIGEIND